MKKILFVGLCMTIFFTISAASEENIDSQMKVELPEETINLIAKMRDTIDCQRETIAKLRFFEANYIALTQGPYQEYAHRLFSQMDKDSLDMMATDIAKSAEYQPRLIQLSNILVKSRKNLQDYDSLYCEIMENPFYMSNHTNFFVRIKRLENSAYKEQKTEVCNLLEFLDTANKGIKSMKSTIMTYEEQLNSLRRKAREAVSEEKKKDFEKTARERIDGVKTDWQARFANREKLYFSKIPWLKEKYERLNVLLETDPLGKEIEEIRDLFISLADKED